MRDELLLKWGTVEQWDLNSKKAQKAAARYLKLNQNLSAALHEINNKHIQSQCDLIDALSDDCEIIHEFDCSRMTKDEAKQYVRDYPR